MFETQHLTLPCLAEAQAQKHVTVNEALAGLDAMVQCAVLGLGRDAPPATPAEGDRYVIGGSPSGLWTGKAGHFAYFSNNGWWYTRPNPGWRVYNLADDVLYAMNAAGAWVPVSGGITELQNATGVGIGMSATPANPLAARLNAALFTARTEAQGGSGNVILACNKSEAPRDAGLAFQSGFLTRAIAGLFGSNRFRLAVSPDGATFTDALSVDDASGIVDQPRLPRFKANTNFDNFAPANTWVKIAVNSVEANDQNAFDPATNRFTAPVAGTYCLGGSLLFKQDASSNARLRGRLIRNGGPVIPGSYGENSAPHLTLATALWIQTLAPLAADDTVELQGSFRGESGYFAATHTGFWGFKVG